MLFERFEVPGLAHYSYAVGCPAAGRIAIVDPRRDVDAYIAFAAEHDVAISHIFETHIHADFASGARELAEQTGAELFLSKYDEGETYDVAFDHTPMGDRETVTIGSVRIEALLTPGHTPEHLSFLVYDGNRSAETPMLMLSGDFLFVGSLGRPDLLGEEAKRGLAGQLYESVQKLEAFPDGLEIHPAHGAGSMCGSGLGGRPVSTLGFERIANPYLAESMTKEEFVDRILSDVPPFPPYYRRMKVLNSEGPALLNGLPGQKALSVREFKERMEEGHVVIDLRDQLTFGGGHIPTSLGIGLRDSLPVWASWVVPYDTPLLLVGSSPEEIEPATRALVRVGLDSVVGYLKGGIQSWYEAGFPLSVTPQLPVRELARELETGDPIEVLDVRSDEEWNAGHIAGARHIHGGFLADRLDELDATKPLAVVCGSGYRSTVALSVLERAGFKKTKNVTGGMSAWKEAGLPTA